MGIGDFAEACLNDLYNRIPGKILIPRDEAEEIVEYCVRVYTNGCLALPLQQFALFPPQEFGHYSFHDGQWEVSWGRGVTGKGSSLSEANQSEEEEYNRVLPAFGSACWKN